MKKTKKQEIDPTTIRDLVRCDEEGRIYWLPRPNKTAWNSRWAGKETFKLANKKGYLYGFIHQSRVPASHVVWAYHYDEWPSLQIDHINRDKKDNRISNLRNVSSRENNRNKPLNKRNKSGASGVRKHKNGRWISGIVVDYKRIHLGYFSNAEDAIAARRNAEENYWAH